MKKLFLIIVFFSFPLFANETKMVEINFERVLGFYEALKKQKTKKCKDIQIKIMKSRLQIINLQTEYSEQTKAMNRWVIELDRFIRNKCFKDTEICKLALIRWQSDTAFAEKTNSDFNNTLPDVKKYCNKETRNTLYNKLTKERRSYNETSRFKKKRRGDV